MPASPGPRLEVREAHGAFRVVEAWLRDHGFFAPGGAGLRADVYFGYGLSQAIRRTATPAPPEPCPELPLAACAIARPAPLSSQSFTVGAWAPTWTTDGYRAAVGAVREAIARGDAYQVNLVQHLAAPFSGDPSSLAGALTPLRPLHPSPLDGEGWSIVSASPELFLSRRGRRIRTRPIKGTRPLGDADELVASEKDAAEHLMIVDLERNDLSRVCEPGSVRWPELLAPHGLAGVEHLVSTVEGTLCEGAGLAEVLEATFPGGSVTGAPKIAAVDLIAELEPVGRGASMGALGRVAGNGDFDLALTIRTFAVAAERIHLWVGGGVVWDSDPGSEVEESWTKAKPLLGAIGSRLPVEPAGRA